MRKRTVYSVMLIFVTTPINASSAPRLSSLLKNLEIGALPVFFALGFGAVGCCEETLTYAASSLGMRIKL